MKPLPGTLRAFLWHFVRLQPWGFLGYMLMSLAWGLDTTLWPIFFQHLIDAINGYKGRPQDVFHAFAPLLWLGFGLVILSQIMFRTMGYIGARILPRCDYAIHTMMFEYTQAHSYRYFSDHFAGSLANKITDMSRAGVDALNAVVTVFPPVLLALCIALTMMALLQPFFAVILGLWFASHITISWITARRTSHFSRAHSESRSVLSGTVIDSLSNFMNVSMFARKAFEREYVGGYRAKERDAHRGLLRYMAKVRLVIGVNTVFGNVAMAWFILHEWQKGAISVGDVMFLMMTSWNVMAMAWHTGMQLLPNLYRDLGTCQQAMSILVVPHEVVDAADATPLLPTRGSIAFENVSFRYRKGNAVFSGKTLHIEGGQKVGLVGFSGSGKTTFVNLILRFFDLDGGVIRIDGQDITQVTQDSLHAAIAMIPQDTSLFHRSLMDNIRYGRLDATDEEVMEASRRAHCHEFIARLEEGYGSLVGERGIKLSGGQRQRIAVARAILKNAPILILDEATSSLDSVTEAYIKESIAQLMRGRTTIVIAHRLSTLADMDRILVFKEGRVVEDGTHRALLAAGGHYAKLWNMQAGGFLPEKESGEG
jgi:ATP-binding cassette subfamily B protein